MPGVTFRGVVRNGAIVFPEGQPPLVEGTEVLVTPMPAERGSGAAILAALDASPKVLTEWVDELEQLIAQGVSRSGCA